MKIAPFETEHFFARYEFDTPYQLCNSDCESISIQELLALAGASLEHLGQQRLVYTESQGSKELREQIASVYSSVDATNAIVLGTPVEGIYLAARAMLNPGDEVIVLSPAYDALINLFEHVVGPENVRRWAFGCTESSWTLDLDDLRAIISPRTRMIVVNFPHNPTGYLPTPEFQRELVAIAEQNGAWLFCDEMYFGLVHSGTAPVPSAADLSPSAIVLSGLSKTQGLPGLRCGWLIVKDQHLHEIIMNWKFYTSICPPVPTEFLSLAALRAREALTKRNINRIEHNLGLADDFFARWPGLFTWRKPQAGTTALVEYHVPSVEAISQQLAQDQGVLIQPAGMLGSDDQHMRIGLGREGFGEALGQFEAWLLEQWAA
jgi:aspartate/methionine/tyrosine aminotransferase